MIPAYGFWTPTVLLLVNVAGFYRFILQQGEIFACRCSQPCCFVVVDFEVILINIIIVIAVDRSIYTLSPVDKHMILLKHCRVAVIVMCYYCAVIAIVIYFNC